MTMGKPANPATADLYADLGAVHHDCFGWALACNAGDRQNAEEALQRSYLKVLEGTARFNGRSTFKTWLFGVVRRTSSEVQRRRGWVRMLPLDALRSVIDPSPSAEAGLAAGQASARLRRALAGLGQRQRQVLHLVFYQDLTIEQAAGVLEIRLGTARTHYQRGKARLRRKLEEQGP